MSYNITGKPYLMSEPLDIRSWDFSHVDENSYNTIESIIDCIIDNGTDNNIEISVIEIQHGDPRCINKININEFLTATVADLVNMRKNNYKYILGRADKNANLFKK